jgi:hypothetical protein
MNISIFPKIKPIKTKEDKTTFAKFGSNPHFPDVVDIKGIKDLIKAITQGGWSPNIYEGFRKKSNFKYTEFLTLDIDDSLTIKEALDRVKKEDILCVCLPTSSHTKQLNKFRLIFPLVMRIDNKQDFTYNMERLSKVFPEADKQCLFDEARLYFNCILNEDGFVYEGPMFQPKTAPKAKNDLLRGSNDLLRRSNLKRIVTVDQDIESIVESIYGTDKRTIPECVDYFIREAHTGLPGNWNNSLNAFCFSLGLSALQYDDVYGIIERLAPDDLDDKDEYVIERAYNQGLEAKESVGDSKKPW